MTTHATRPNINTYLADELMVGTPDTAGPLAVFPLFGPEPRNEYVAFAEGRSNGVAIKELEGGASVNDLTVLNPTQLPVLLYEGEEVLGAQQNRTFDVTVLVAAGGTLRVPVSCVEAGRWQDSRHDEQFVPAPQAAYPELRRAKSRHARQRVAAGQEARADQGAVWADIDAMSARHGARSRTGAMHDVYESRRKALRELAEAIKRQDSQCGALAAIGGSFAVLDFVSRADVFAALHGPLVQGYALDALEAAEDEPPTLEDARSFLARVTATRPSERRSIGLGRDLRFAANEVAGSGLAADQELIQLTAFPEDASEPTARGGRIRRPSTRR